jgi:hypothetical protein
MNYYVYYKVTPDQADSVRLAAQSLFKKVQEECGVRGRLMRRRDDPATYMEVYEGVADESAFEALLEREGQASGIARHLERFVNI